MAAVKLLDLGLMPYGNVLATQEELFNTNLNAKAKEQPTSNTLILCEHPPVYTLGKSGKSQNILVDRDNLNAELFQVTRGGDVTFHGPGQLVVYPILDLDTLSISVAQYVYNLEELIIQTIAEYDIVGERIEGASGVWIGAGTPKARKISAVGAKVSRHITMHGLAVNVNTDLNWFSKIVSCGLANMGVTSLQQELGKPIDMQQFKTIMLAKWQHVFHTEWSK